MIDSHMELQIGQEEIIDIITKYLVERRIKIISPISVIHNADNHIGVCMKIEHDTFDILGDRNE